MNLRMNEFKKSKKVMFVTCTEFKQLIVKADSLFRDKLNVVFFFQPKSENDMRYIFLEDNFGYPVFIDMNNAINKLNHFPKQSFYQCFLLDKNNKILMIGKSCIAV
jgi:hypothetical protein